MNYNNSRTLSTIAGFLTCFISTAHAAPESGAALIKTVAAGGEGGDEFAINCTSGQVLAGLTGRASGKIDAIGALCVSVDESGNWVGSPVDQGTQQGGSGGQPFTTTCPINTAVVGFEGSKSAGSITNIAGYIQLRCKSLDSQQTVTSGLASQTTLQTFGIKQTISSDEYLCPNRSLATGLYGKKSLYVNSYGISCLEKPEHVGRWTELFDWPLIAIHTLLTPQGNVLSFGTDDNGVQGAQFYYDVWSPNKGTGTTAHNTLDNTLGVDSFCSAAIILPESGNIIMPGGDQRFGSGFNQGITDAPIFNTDTASLSRAADMAFARWYPTSTILANGEVLLTGGRDSAGNSAITPEIYSPITNEWRSLFGASMTGINYFYPRHWLAPNGKIFGMTVDKMYYINTNGTGSLQELTGMPTISRGIDSTAVMYRPGKILQLGGSSGTNPKGVFTIDISNETPVARVVTEMNHSRKAWANTVVMPDGEVMVFGGSAVANQLVDVALTPEAWNPATEAWNNLSRSQVARLYHSTALLLPSGKILLSGGGAPGPIKNLNGEIYSPPYLYDNTSNLAIRPNIISMPTAGSYGEKIGIQHASDEAISRVTLLKAGAVTHSFNMEQRFIELDFDDTYNSVRVEIPKSANIAPPGFYLLFLLNDKGVPSVGKMIKITANGSATDPTPTPAIDKTSTSKDTEITIDVLANDTGSGLKIEGVNDYTVEGGRAKIVNNRILYTPKSGYVGEDSFWYAISNAQGLSNATQVFVSILSPLETIVHPAATNTTVTPNNKAAGAGSTSWLLFMLPVLLLLRSRN
jgi:hypothetical protein